MIKMRIILLIYNLFLFRSFGLLFFRFSDFFRVPLIVYDILLHEVAALANAFGIHQPVLVLTFGRETLAAVNMVAMIAHTFRIVQLVCVLTSRDCPPLSISFLGRFLGRFWV